jgi:formylglycine-generating enzyme required for sulfatase activity
MKLIRGRDFGEMLLEREHPAEHRRRFLSIFESICQTMAYVHSRGVVHRDLKPANVMIGSFGEVNIVDWGMGKVLGDSEAKTSSPSATSTTALNLVETVRNQLPDARHTAVGTIMGTLAYMPPEQAAGDTENLDERCDVFALGAILCEILTGKPPYVGDDQLTQALRGKVKDARDRLARCGADEEIVRLCEDCLSPAVAARPRHAGVVAERVSRYLAKAEQRAVDAQVRAQAARRTQSLVIALGVVIASALVVALWLWNQAQTALDEYDLLALSPELEGAIEAQLALHPAWPSAAPALAHWLEAEGRPLAAQLSRLEQTLAELESKRTAVASGELGFTDPRLEFKHENLAGLVDRLRAFAAPGRGVVADVEQRLDWANQVEELTVERHRDRWDRARAALRQADGVVASELYRWKPIDLTPQIGLIPIGLNPATGLWEFYDLRSAWEPGADPTALPVPSFDSDGRLAVTEDLGVVFVLIPGSRFQHLDQPASGAPEVIELDPFFVAKYELTQKQWARLRRGEMPSFYPAGGRHEGAAQLTLLSNPVEGVSWNDCDELVRQQGWVLPTSAQWECAARGGTATKWSSGDSVADLVGAANIADRAAEAANRSFEFEPGFEDGHVLHARVGSFDPNPFGLFDVHGNVWEWCRDEGYHLGDSVARAGDGLRLGRAGATPTGRISRGGSFAFNAERARSNSTFFDAPTQRDGNLGLRPARMLRGQ